MYPQNVHPRIASMDWVPELVQHVLGLFTPQLGGRFGWWLEGSLTDVFGCGSHSDCFSQPALYKVCYVCSLLGHIHLLRSYFSETPC